MATGSTREGERCVASARSLVVSAQLTAHPHRLHPNGVAT